MQALRALAHTVYSSSSSKDAQKELKAGPLLEVAADWLIRRAEGCSTEDAAGAAPAILARLPVPSLVRLTATVSELTALAAASEHPPASDRERPSSDGVP